ncbi:MAG: hypothetical protein PSN34_02310 [Urechidicola sp.]|nr:hypothetical protein [Urechidicola sp.]
MFGKAFKSRKHYVFDYKPRYYDERKERIENLKLKYSDKESKEDATRIHFTKNNLKNEWVKNKRLASNRSSTIRLAIIITILVGIAVYILDLHTLF